MRKAKDSPHMEINNYNSIWVTKKKDLGKTGLHSKTESLIYTNIHAHSYTHVHR